MQYVVTGLDQTNLVWVFVTVEELYSLEDVGATGLLHWDATCGGSVYHAVQTQDMRHRCTSPAALENLPEELESTEENHFFVILLLWLQSNPKSLKMLLLLALWISLRFIQKIQY